MPLPPPLELVVAPHALHVEATFEPQNRAAGLITARHPDSPFVGYPTVDPDDPARFDAFGEEVRQIALRYLKQLLARIDAAIPARERELVHKWRDALAVPDHPRFGWLPLSAGKPGPPMISFRSGDTFVLLASERQTERGAPQDYLASGFGLRVVGHLSRPRGAGQPRPFCITSFAACTPWGQFRDASLIDTPASTFTIAAFFDVLDERADEIAATLRLDRCWFTQLRLYRAPASLVGFELHGTSYEAGPGVQSKLQPEERTPYAFIVRGTSTLEGKTVSLHAFERRPLVTHAAVSQDYFPVDPASMGPASTIVERRPTRSEDTLGTYLGNRLAIPSADVNATMALREAPDFGEPAAPATGLRGDEFGVASARAHLERFFERLARWGYSPETYFKFARMPALQALGRAGIRPGPGKDGHTVNARVAIGSWKQSFYRSTAPTDQPAVSFHFALGDVSTRTRRQRPANGYARVEYLGVAADPRWVWHEIGHAMLAGNVGELEFRFAHSPGDALAAIALDPHSQLDGRARGATFPWIFIPRRHDRCAARGWSWSGTMHLPMQRRARPDLPAFKGYWSEQILSSSLFRLYRALGGDALLPSGAPDRGAREAAADYTLYLIAKAIHLFAYTGAQSENTADFFVTQLINADIGMAAFTTKTVDDGNVARTFTRAGGWARKVVRWAFERQGLYASGFTNGPGLPQPVDLHIATARPATDPLGMELTPYGPGSYAPVSLEWSPGDGDAPWHAVEAIERNGQQLHVTVGNHGSQDAANVQVSMHVCAVVGGVAPLWNDPAANWQTCTSPAGSPTVVAAGASVRYGPFALPAGIAAPFVIVAAATCPDDKSNIDDSTNLACAALPMRLADLVGCDNNLGLRLIAN
jgi:hypothetical protein